MDERLGRRLAGSLSAVIVGLALLAGLWLLPDLTPDDAIPAIGQESLHGRNSEIVAVEVIRALVGSIGIVAAVPLTTFVAAALIVRPGRTADAYG